jgi:hypothetical protein
VQFTFAAQGYTNQGDWDSFFQYLSTNEFAVLMKSCGPPYTLKIMGGVPADAPVDVCFYHKGGYLIECKGINNSLMELKVSENMNHRVDDDKLIFYALANTTSMKNGKPVQLYAITSVAFDGPCIS